LTSAQFLSDPNAILIFKETVVAATGIADLTPQDIYLLQVIQINSTISSRSAREYFLNESVKSVMSLVETVSTSEKNIPEATVDEENYSFGRLNGGNDYDADRLGKAHDSKSMVEIQSIPIINIKYGIAIPVPISSNNVTVQKIAVSKLWSTVSTSISTSVQQGWVKYLFSVLN